ncbi:flagellar assembly protein FliH [Aquitalea magnusonii]|uniref:Flagellar assembly protein FliH n=2 Tax=Chromobacteriaceae TaxID=1499392 RepID=A0A318JYQ6_9NEIS|nr:flagellar assembly protein FliH [Aquitalea magnusonii]
MPAELSQDDGEFSPSQLAGLDALRRHLEQAPTAAAAEMAEEQAEAAAAAAAEAAAQEEAVGYPTASELEAIHQEAWQTGYDEGVQAGHAEGLARGMQQGHDQASEQFAQLWAPLQELSGNFARELARVEEELSGALLQLALQLAERLAGEHIAHSDTAIVAQLRQVLGELPANLSQARLRVNPADLAAAREFLQQETPETQWQWIEDAHIQRGGCIIDTSSLQLDLRLASRLAALSSALGLDAAQDDLAD